MAEKVSSTQCFIMVSEIEVIVSVFADVEGGMWLLVRFCKWFQTLADEGAWNTVQMELKKMYTGLCRQSVKVFIRRI